MQVHRVGSTDWHMDRILAVEAQQAERVEEVEWVERTVEAEWIEQTELAEQTEQASPSVRQCHSRGLKGKEATVRWWGRRAGCCLPHPEGEWRTRKGRRVEGEKRVVAG